MSVGILQHRAADGERAGLVEDGGVDLGQALQRIAGFDQDAALEQAPRRHDLHRRHGQAERAGTGDDQKRDGIGQRQRQRSPEGEPAEEDGRGQAMHRRHID